MASTNPTVFEFGYLCSDDEANHTKKQYTTIPKGDFEYLEKRCLTEGDAYFNKLIQPRFKGGCRLLQVKNYAGVIFVPSGRHIEVLPKTGKDQQSEEEARQTLLKMLQTLGEFRHIQLENVGQKTLNMPLLEIFISQFLKAVNHVVKRGLRSDYVRQQDNLLVKKGKLNMAGQLRHNSVLKHRFYCEFDEYVQNRPVNRLLKTAIQRIQGYTRDHLNQKLLRELQFAFDEVPASISPKQDFDSIRLDRGMAYYQPSLAWARLILAGSSPISMKGQAEAPSLLFPMESVFEAFVAKTLQDQLQNGFSLRTQTRAEKLVTHHVETNNQRDLFTLKPDLMIEKDGKPICILDTKWKRIDSKSINNFDLSQADFYQMFAYGQKYLSGSGNLALLYPKTELFSKPIKGCFKFSDKLSLWVLPFEIVSTDKSKIIMPEEPIFPLDIGLS
ncbi:restriction endonuclease [Veronia nyctiphanis]|uniref:Restriction endonuclease n=1 Tax=Veronia nyctiphanis TaxID=1278244 RepID=A0A4Q0YML9_9GAMM|nr:McrC family protein [Veronia nyctiphanis]RXJ71673.1 restriction endonuclease [Veronia nyctiphanis]